MTASQQIESQLLDLAWRQWTELGVAGTKPYGQVAVGIEELLLLTAALADADPRLRDEALDWCAKFGRFVSKPRLKNLLRSVSPRASASFATFAASHNATTHAGWPGDEGGKAVGVRLSGKSKLGNPARPALLNLRLRTLFGVGARADVLAALLSAEAPHVSAADLAYLGYTKRNIAQVLDDLALSGLVRSQRVRNQVRFSWKRRQELEALIRPLPGRIPRWPNLIRVLIGLHELTQKVAGMPETVAGIEAVKFLEVARSDLESLGIEPMQPSARPAATWPRFIRWATKLARDVASGRTPGA